MFRKKSMQSYKPLILPIDKPIKELKPKEAEMYFNWFLSHVDDRADYIRKVAAKDLKIPEDMFDFSPESLKLLCAWFMTIGETQKIPYRILQEMKNDLKKQGHQDDAIDFFISQHSTELSARSLYIVIDMGMYLGKTWLVTYPVLRWDYYTKPKSDFSVNSPQIFGFVEEQYDPPFHPTFDPVLWMRGFAEGVMSGRFNENRMFEIFKIWEKKVPKE